MTVSTDTAPAAASPHQSALSTAVLLAELDEIRPLLAAPYVDKAERIEHAREFVAIEAELCRRGVATSAPRHHGIATDRAPGEILDELQEARFLLDEIMRTAHLEVAGDDAVTFSFALKPDLAERFARFGALSTDLEPDCDTEDGADAEPDTVKWPTFAEYVQNRPNESAWRVKSESATLNMSQTGYLMMHGMDRRSAISCVRRNSRLYR